MENEIDTKIDMDFEYNKEYDLSFKPYIEEWYKIHKDCDVNEYEEYIEIVKKEKLFTEKELIIRELSELQNWFDTYFQPQFIQSLWQTNFKTSHDDYFDKYYTDIEELKLQGETVRKRIKELRSRLKEKNNT